MGLIELIKATAIRSADCLNALNDPFPAFDRPAFPKRDGKSLVDLESEFYSDLTGNFWACDGRILVHRLPIADIRTLDLGDQAIWHGVHCAMLAMRYSVSDGDQRSRTYADLVEATKGLLLHQTVHGEPVPRLIRGVSDDLKIWQDDASNDSLTGHIFGIYALWKWGPTSLQPVCVQLALGIGTELLGHNNALVGPDGKSTTYGSLIAGWKTDPLRLTLALAVYAMASTITKQPAFMKAYSDLYRQYKPLVVYPKVKLWWIENQNDAHRAAMHLAMLADLTTGEANERYMDGLERLHDMTAKLGNVWVNALVALGRAVQYPNDRAVALKVLSEFTLEDKQSNPGKDNSTPAREATIREQIPSFKRILWNGTYMANQPLPRWMARTQDFFWQRNLRSLDPGSSGGAPDSRLNGGDFLAAYWLSRITGILNSAD